MFNYVWPIAMVVLSNVAYQICAKSVPNDMDPLASLTITYIVGAVLVGLEVGWIYAYRAGWQVSTAQIVHSAFLAVALIFVGALLYKEALTWNKLVGILVCLIGLVFINYK
jgi:multidrug transporter EmrE-like cation transporter